MSAPAVNSIIEVADWFFKRAEQDNVYLENDKLQHLLFLAQVHYALNNNFQYFVPGVFICDERGFSEPNLSRILSFGLPMMPKPEFAEHISSYLEVIWKKYSPMSIRELSEFIKSSDSYTKNYHVGQKNLVPLEDMALQFRTNINLSALQKAADKTSKKILISQNGPVVVSKWQPRKVNTNQSKEKKHV